LYCAGLKGNKKRPRRPL